MNARLTKAILNQVQFKLRHPKDFSLFCSCAYPTNTGARSALGLRGAAKGVVHIAHAGAGIWPLWLTTIHNVAGVPLLLLALLLFVMGCEVPPLHFVLMLIGLWALRALLTHWLTLLTLLLTWELTYSASTEGTASTLQ
jgi:hypothetical protein